MPFRNPPFSSILIANRGEIGVRIARSAADLGIRTVGVYSADDQASGHVDAVDVSVELSGTGPSAYLNIHELVSIAVANDCHAVHPGYGFLSERSDFATAVRAAGIAFIGPSNEVLRSFGDKSSARALATELSIPIVPGVADASADGLRIANEFFAQLPKGSLAIIKAVAGGGGRGMRIVREQSELDSLWQRASSEALNAFGDGSLYIEQYIERARHIEVQILGDGTGAISVLGDRECSVQRRYQKLIELAPAPHLSDALRAALHQAAQTMGEHVRYSGLATLEFLVDVATNTYFFIEANARLQVEHTVTEAVTGLDLVALQIHVAGGASIAELGLPASVVAKGCAVQVRVCAERVNENLLFEATDGTLTAFACPTGPNVRVDTFAYVGYTVTTNFDSLLAKVVVALPSGNISRCLSKADRALASFDIVGIETNIGFLRAILAEEDVANGTFTTTRLDNDLAVFAMRSRQRAGNDRRQPAPAAVSSSPRAAIDRNDPLAVLDLGRKLANSVDVFQNSDAYENGSMDAPPDEHAVVAPLQGTVLSVDVAQGAAVQAGAVLVVMEAMKMEHEVRARTNGTVGVVHVGIGQTVSSGIALLEFAPSSFAEVASVTQQAIDLNTIRSDLAEVLARHDGGRDDQRPAAVAKRRGSGQRTARENIADLCDHGSFHEYGAVVVAAQRRRRSMADLIEKTPADGLVGGIGTINAEQFGDDASRAVVVTYDYTVLAGTQGNQNHRKKDRLFEIAEKWRLPVVLFAEGGGGRPGDTDGLGVTGLDCLAFHIFGRLSGQVPIVGITSGYCFAGNAALLGCCDVIIATKGSNIGMGGPAMIEGGGLGAFHPKEIGPLADQVPNGVVDLIAHDEADAVRLAQKYLSYFQGVNASRDEAGNATWTCADQRELRNAIPENRLRAYDIRAVINGMTDADTVLELRPHFGVGMITAFARIEGRAVGIIANNPVHLGGAIDADACDKACRFMQLCDNFKIPLVFLCDTPGFMVGPEAEKAALVRKAGRMFVTSASVSVPFCTVVLRKGYGLGAQAMAGGGFKIPVFTIAWPTGEFGGMGLEGAVKLGYRNELAAVEEPAKRKEMFDTMVANMYKHGKALSVASHFEIDAVIDPAETRKWILRAITMDGGREKGSRPFVDTW
jgi:acetyl/propionyl-CoA carboxylase alpha subunit